MRSVLRPLVGLTAWLSACTSTVGDSRTLADGGVDVPVDRTPAPDAPAADGGSSGRYEVTAESFCGVAVFHSRFVTEPDFYSVYAAYRDGVSELHLVRFTREGTVVFDRTLVTSSTERLCVSRRSLAFASRGRDSTYDLLVAWTAGSSNARLPRAMLVSDQRGDPVAGLVFAPTDNDAEATSQDSLLAVGGWDTVSVVYEGPSHALRVRRFDLTRTLPSSTIMPLYGPAATPTRWGDPTLGGPLVIGEQGVAFAHRVAGRSLLSVRGLNTATWTLGEPVDIPTELADPTPVSFGDGNRNRLLFRGGAHDQTVRVVSDVNNPAAQRTVAADTAWDTTDGESGDESSADLWISHGRSQSGNDRVTLAFPSDTDAGRCALLQARDAQSEFLRVARARSLGHKQLIAAIEAHHVVTGFDGQELHYRFLPDGVSACAPSP